MKNFKFLLIALFALTLTGCFENEEELKPINSDTDIRFVTLNDQMHGEPFSQTIQSISVNGSNVDSSNFKIEDLFEGDVIRISFELKHSKVRELAKAYDDSLAGMKLISAVNAITKDCVYEFEYTNEAKVNIDIREYLNLITLSSHRGYGSDLACGADANIFPWQNTASSLKNRIPLNFNPMFNVIARSQSSDNDNSRINLFEYGYDFTNTNIVETFYTIYSGGWFSHVDQGINNCSPSGMARDVRKFENNSTINQR